MSFIENGYSIIETNACIGKNGFTNKKREGDLKTPLGIYNIGIAFGKHDLKNLNIPYKKLNEYYYWVDDSSSKYYNKFIDIREVDGDWKSAEHLTDYPIQYEYVIQINYNKDCIPNQGSAVFLHCKKGETTSGCISVDRKKMIEIIKKVNKDTIFYIVMKEEIINGAEIYNRKL